jgi:hypothetical protein
MKFRSFFSLAGGILSFAAITFLFGRAQAAPEVFIIDNSQSFAVLSGGIANSPIDSQQDTGSSLATTYSGNINVNISGSTIQFTGSSAIIAQTNGVWQPGVGGASGSAAADYGAEAPGFGLTVYGAMRNIVLDLISPSLTIMGTNFDSSALVFSFVTNSGAVLDYNAAGGLVFGSLPLAGYSTNTIANSASLTTNGTTQKLIIQFNTTFSFTLSSPYVMGTPGNTPLILSGIIVATRSVVASPLISSIILTNQSVVLTVENATMQSQLQSSTDLTTWSPASPPITTINVSSGLIIFTTPMSGPQTFFRVQK